LDWIQKETAAPTWTPEVCVRILGGGGIGFGDFSPRIRRGMDGGGLQMTTASGDGDLRDDSSGRQPRQQ
jgi:hypothetical protein